MLITPEDITGDGSDHPLTAVSTLCSWFQISVVSNASGGTMRIGNEVSATRGVPLGGSGFAGQLAPVTCFGAAYDKRYDLNQIRYLVPNGDVISLAYGG